MWLRMLLLSFMAVWLAGPACGEYYQYRDENGVLRFTDDLSRVPPEQRTEAKAYISIESDTVLPQSETATEGETPASSSVEKGDGKAAAGSSEGQDAQQVEELNGMQAELQKIYKELQEEQTTLRARAPAESASYKQKAAYNAEVDALNAKIADYETRLDEFTQKVEAYNAQLRQ